MHDPLPPLQLTFDRPENQTAPPILILAAMGVPARYYNSFAAQLVKLGHPVARAHWRDEDREFPLANPEYGYADLAEVDVPEAVATVRAEFGSDPVVVGHSLGGQIAVLSAANSQPLPGIVIIASGSNYWRGSGPQWAVSVGFASAVVPPLVKLFGYWPGGRFKFGGRQPARLMRDWARLGRTGRFEPEAAQTDLEQRLVEVTTPVFAMTVAGDTYVSEAATSNLLAKLPAASRTERWHWRPEDRHQRGHFNWVRPGTEPARRIHEWIIAVAA